MSSIYPKNEDSAYSSVWSELVANSAEGKFSILNTWDSKHIDHPEDPVRITLSRNDATSFKITIHAKFYDDPKKPHGLPNFPFYGLWEYEGLSLSSNCFILNCLYKLYLLDIFLLICKSGRSFLP